MSLEYYRPLRELHGRLGMIVPSWFPPEHDPDLATRILATTLADLETVLEPADCLVVVDGSAVAEHAAERACGAASCGLLVLRDGPHGKGGAVGRGLRELLARPGLEWFVIRDHDGDHFLEDTPRLVRLGLQMLAESGTDRILVNGARTSPARPMGWVREQYERLVNEVVWRGLHFAAARQGRAVSELYLPPGVAVPDLQSGYKLYSRAAAELVAAAYERADWPSRRWGCEVVATVEVVAAGGAFGEMPRSALDQQPLTTYEGGAERALLHGDIVLAAARRLELPGSAVLTWLDAAIARGLLRTLGEQRAALAALRAHVAEGLGWTGQPAAAPWIC